MPSWGLAVAAACALATLAGTCHAGDTQTLDAAGPTALQYDAKVAVAKDAANDARILSRLSDAQLDKRLKYSEAALSADQTQKAAVAVVESVRAAKSAVNTAANLAAKHKVEVAHTIADRKRSLALHEQKLKEVAHDVGLRKMQGGQDTISRATEGIKEEQDKITQAKKDLHDTKEAALSVMKTAGHDAAQQRGSNSAKDKLKLVDRAQQRMIKNAEVEAADEMRVAQREIQMYKNEIRHGKRVVSEGKLLMEKIDSHGVRELGEGATPEEQAKAMADSIAEQDAEIEALRARKAKADADDKAAGDKAVADQKARIEAEAARNSGKTVQEMQTIWNPPVDQAAVAAAKASHDKLAKANQDKYVRQVDTSDATKTKLKAAADQQIKIRTDLAAAYAANRKKASDTYVKKRTDAADKYVREETARRESFEKAHLKAEQDKAAKAKAKAQS